MVCQVDVIVEVEKGEMLPGESEKLCEVPIRGKVEVNRGHLGSRYGLCEVNWGQSKFLRSFMIHK